MSDQISGFLWVTFKDRGSGCIDHGTEEEARVAASAHGSVETIKALPYPARPRLDPVERSDFPSFCYKPGSCSGKGYCINPHGRACTS